MREHDMRLRCSTLLFVCSWLRLPGLGWGTAGAGNACGDLNRDALLTIGDALLAAQFAVALRDCASVPGFELCDLSPSTPDGTCGIGDALRIAQCSVGLVSREFSCRPLACP